MGYYRLKTHHPWAFFNCNQACEHLLANACQNHNDVQEHLEEVKQVEAKAEEKLRKLREEAAFLTKEEVQTATQQAQRCAKDE